MRIPTESEIAEINSTHFCRHAARNPADLLFVFGTSEGRRAAAPIRRFGSGAQGCSARPSSAAA